MLLLQRFFCSPVVARHADVSPVAGDCGRVFVVVAFAVPEDLVGCQCPSAEAVLVNTFPLQQAKITPWESRRSASVSANVIDALHITVNHDEGRRAGVCV